MPLVLFTSAGIKSASESFSWKNRNPSDQVHFPTSLLCSVSLSQLRTIPWPSTTGVQSTVGVWDHPEQRSANAVIFPSPSQCHFIHHSWMSLFPLVALQVSLPFYFSSFHISLSLILNRFSPYPLLFPLLPSFTWILPSAGFKNWKIPP